MAAFDSTESFAAPTKYIEEPIDLLTKKADQLHSMLTVTYGGGFEAFHAFSDSIQDNYLWACADLAEDIGKLAERINSERVRNSTEAR